MKKPSTAEEDVQLKVGVVDYIINSRHDWRVAAGVCERDFWWVK